MQFNFERHWYSARHLREKSSFVRSHLTSRSTVGRIIHTKCRKSNRFSNFSQISHNSQTPQLNMYAESGVLDASEAARAVTGGVEYRRKSGNFSRNDRHLGCLTHTNSRSQKNRRRCDVSRDSRRARSDIELSRNDIEVRLNDTEKAHSVDFRSHSVDFRSVLSANALSMTLSANHDRITGNSKTAANRSAIRDQKRAF